MVSSRACSIISEIESEQDLRHCRNCGALLTGRYCAQCGQDSQRARLDVLESVRDTISLFSNFESRIVRTVIGLTLRPGQTAAEYADGARVRYTGPVKYAAVCATLWVLSYRLFAPSGEVQRLMASWGQLLNIGGLPFIAISVWLGFLGSRRNYAEALALTLFTSGHLFLFRALWFPCATLLPDEVGSTLRLVDALGFLAYFVWAMGGFYRKRVQLWGLRAMYGVVGTLIVSAGLALLASTL